MLFRSHLDRFIQLHGAHADALLISLDLFAIQHSKQLATLARKYNLTLVSTDANGLKAGADISVGLPVDGMAHDAARMLTDLIMRTPVPRTRRYQTPGIIDISTPSRLTTSQIDRLFMLQLDSHQLRVTYQTPQIQEHLHDYTTTS